MEVGGPDIWWGLMLETYFYTCMCLRWLMNESSEIARVRMENLHIHQNLFKAVRTESLEVIWVEKENYLCEFGSYVCYLCEGDLKILSLSFLFLQASVTFFIPSLHVTESTFSSSADLHVVCFQSV